MKNGIKYLMGELIVFIALEYFVNDRQIILMASLVTLLVLLVIEICLYVAQYINNKRIAESTQKAEEGKAEKLEKVEEVTQPVDPKVDMKKVLHKDITVEITRLKEEFNKKADKIIADYMNNAVTGVVSENENFTEKDMVNSVNSAVNNTYKDISTHVRNKIMESNEDLISTIEDKMKNYVSMTGDSDDAVSNLEVNEMIDESKSLYDRELNHLLTRQEESIKRQIDVTINTQLHQVRNEMKKNNIDYGFLEKVLKKNTRDIMEDYSKKNEAQIHRILTNISDDFGQLHEDINYDKINEDIQKDLEVFKEKYINSVQKNIDYTLVIVKKLSEMGVIDFKMVRRKEIKMLFERSMVAATKEIDIITPSMNNHVMFKEGLYDKMKDALRRGVKLNIIYGVEDKKELESIQKNSQKIATSLSEDFKDFGENFTIKNKYVPETMLICDDKYAVLGNFNYLSYEGKVKNINDNSCEMAALVTNEKFVNKIKGIKFK